MFTRSLQSLRVTLVSFFLGITVMIGVGAATTLVWAENSPYVGSAGTLVGCPADFQCRVKQPSDAVGWIIPQCEIVSSQAVDPSFDALKCCNYTLDAFVQLAINIAMLILGLSGTVALVVVVWGGFQYVTSAGNKKQIQAGTDTITNAIIGLVIIFSSWMIVNFVMGSLVGSKDKATNPLNQQLASLFDGVNKWTYQANICSKIQFGEIAKVPELSPAGGSTGARAFVPTTTQTEHTFTTEDECKQYCKVFNITTNPQTLIGGPFVQSYEQQKCLCKTYSTLSNTTFTGNQLSCGQKAKMGDQQWYGVKCASNPTTEPTYQSWPRFFTSNVAYKDQTAGPAVEYKCWRQGAIASNSAGGDTVSTFLPVEGNPAPSCEEVGHCCKGTTPEVDIIEGQKPTTFDRCKALVGTTETARFCAVGCGEPTYFCRSINYGPSI